MHEVSIAQHLIGLSCQAAGGQRILSLQLRPWLGPSNQVGVVALWHRQIPPNDEGLAIGQIAVAGVRLS